MTVKEYFNALIIMYIALIIGQLLFMAVAVFLVLSGLMEAALPEESNLFLIVVAFVAVGSVFAGNFLYNKQLNSIKQLKDFREQFTKLKALIIMRLALLEGPTILAIVFYLLTGSWIFLFLSLLIILLFLKLKPNKEKIISELELSEEIKKQLENPDTVITLDTNS